MSDQNDERLDKLLKDLLVKDSLRSANENCPDEELLADYLMGTLADAERDKLDTHLADCPVCVYVLAVAHNAGAERATQSTPRYFLERARSLFRPAGRTSDFFDVVVRLARDTLELVSTSGQLVPAGEPSGLRGKSGRADTSIRVAKEFGPWKLALDIERLNPEACQVIVAVESGRGDPAPVRLTLSSEDREQASLIVRHGHAVFDHLSTGQYRLALSQEGRELGSVRLTISGE